MPVLEIVLPLPPSTNNLYANVRGVGRLKTKAHKAWINEAGYAPIAGAWRRLTEEAGNGIPWQLIITAYGLRKGRDVSNCIKAVEDLVCAMTGLEDCNTVEVIARKSADRQDRPCIVVWVATLIGEEVEAR